MMCKHNWIIAEPKCKICRDCKECCESNILCGQPSMKSLDIMTNKLTRRLFSQNESFEDVFTDLGVGLNKIFKDDEEK